MANGILQATKAIGLLDAMRRLRKGQREAAGPTSAEVQMQATAVREQRQERQYRINKWIDLYNKTSGTEKEHLWNMMREDYDSFDPETKQALGYHLRLTPLGEQEKKKRLFLKSKPMPKGSGHIPEEKPHEWSSEWFGQKDWQWQYESYMGLNPPPVPESVRVTKELYAKREKGGIIRLINMEDEAMDTLAEKYKMTKEGMAALGWKVPVPGTEHTITSGPNTYEGFMQMDVLKGGAPTQMIRPTGKKLNVQGQEAPKEVIEFASYHAVDTAEESKTSTGRLFMQYKELLKSKGMTPDRALKMTVGTAFPDWNFKVIDPGKYEAPWFGGNRYYKGEEEFLTFFPGKLTAFPALGNTMKYYYHDPTTNTVYSGKGEAKGTYEEVTVEAMRSRGEETSGR